MVMSRAGLLDRPAGALVGCLALLAVAGLLSASGALDRHDGDAAAIGAGTVAPQAAPALDARGDSMHAARHAAALAAAPTTAPRLTAARPRRDPNALLDYERCYG